MTEGPPQRRDTLAIAAGRPEREPGASIGARHLHAAVCAPARVRRFVLAALVLLVVPAVASAAKGFTEEVASARWLIGFLRPPEPGELRAEEHLQIGAITQYVTSLARTHNELADRHHGIDHQAG
jgi:hypothetical protein